MQLLFKREQTKGIFTKINFKLWGKLDLETEEQELIDRYEFADAVLIRVAQPGLISKSILVGLSAFLISYVLFPSIANSSVSIPVATLFGIAVGYGFFNEEREVIYVKDLLHGRTFKCSSVTELSRKEAWLETVVSYLRQVLETSKNWEGTETLSVLPLPPELAKQKVIAGL